MTPYYDRDGITIWNADCNDVDWPTPDEVGLLLTDPPYGIAVNTEYDRFGTGANHEPIHEDDRPFDPAPLVRYRAAIFGANHYATRLPEGGKWIVWHKHGASPLLAAAELCWHNAGGRSVDYYSTFHGEARQRDGVLHPTQKPVSLMVWVLEKFTESGDLIFDPYMGSGPIAQACLELNRRYIGIEIVEEYCKVAVERLARTTPSMFGGEV